MNIEIKKLFIMRHAESLEDIDKTAYERIADKDMPLSEYGKEQAMTFGLKFIQELATGKFLRLILSPSKRVLETAEIIVSGLPSHIKWSLSTEYLIVKQDWGNVTIHNRSEIEKERYRVGVLRYQFPNGENGLEMLFRFDLFSKKIKKEIEADSSKQITLIITHGFEFRVLLKSLLKWTEEYFESLAHPYHCELKRLTYYDDEFLLLDEMRIHNLSKNPNFIQR